MNEYYKRQIELWGEEAQKRLSSKSVAIIGSGGLGCSIGIALGSSGLGMMHLIDFDTVSTHNIHRQIAFELGDEGAYKSDKLATKIKSRNSFVNVTSHTCSFSEFKKLNISVDLLIDATDNLLVRSEIEEEAKNINVPWLHGAIEEWRGQVCFFDKASFVKSFAITDKKPNGITPPPVMMIGALEATIALRYLAGLNIEKDIFYMLYFSEAGIFEKRSFTLSL